jgi:hypothetical protein
MEIAILSLLSLSGYTRGLEKYCAQEGSNTRPHASHEFAQEQMTN